MKKLAALLFVVFCGCQPASVSDPKSTSTPPLVNETTGDEAVVDAEELGLNADELPPSDGPVVESLADAIEQLTVLRDTVSAGFAAKDIDSIHGELHEVGDLLEATKEMVEASTLPADKTKEVLATVESLFDDFGAVDMKLHDQPGKDYAEVSDSIDASILKLNELVKQ